MRAKRPKTKPLAHNRQHVNRPRHALRLARPALPVRRLRLMHSPKHANRPRRALSLALKARLVRRKKPLEAKSKFVDGKLTTDLMCGSSMY
jgi:hypothetical protein